MLNKFVKLFQVIRGKRNILSIYPNDLVLKNTNSTKFGFFLDLKINFANNWLINVYDKMIHFDFKVNSLTNWSSCISKKISKNVLFP